VLRMIDTVDANSNVGTVYIKLDINNEWNDEIIRMMNRYSNVYDVEVFDSNE